MPNHYDACRPGYCPGCGQAPGGIVNGVCTTCGEGRTPAKRSREQILLEDSEKRSIWPGWRGAYQGHPEDLRIVRRKLRGYNPNRLPNPEGPYQG